MITTIYSKPLYNGGRVFIKYNDDTKQYYIGNTASTAVSDGYADIYIHDSTIKQIREIGARLSNFLGYTEYRNNWDKDNDTYGDIKKAGL